MTSIFRHAIVFLLLKRKGFCVTVENNSWHLINFSIVAIKIGNNEKKMDSHVNDRLKENVKKVFQKRELLGFIKKKDFRNE